LVVGSHLQGAPEHTKSRHTGSPPGRGLFPSCPPLAADQRPHHHLDPLPQQDTDTETRRPRRQQQQPSGGSGQLHRTCWFRFDPRFGTVVANSRVAWKVRESSGRGYAIFRVTGPGDGRRAPPGAHDQVPPPRHRRRSRGHRYPPQPALPQGVPRNRGRQPADGLGGLRVGCQRPAGSGHRRERRLPGRAPDARIPATYWIIGTTLRPTTYGTSSESFQIPHTCVFVASWSARDCGRRIRRGWPVKSPLWIA